MGKTVECGSCDNRFKVTDDVQVKEKKKFYPGEKKGVHLERFATSSASVVASSPEATQVGFQEAHYQADVNADRIGPPRPRRTISSIIGVSIMVMMILIFLIFGREDGPMRDMETTNRFVLAGFTAVLGSLLILYGLGQNKLRGMLLCLVLGGGLLAMPALFPGNPISASAEEAKPEVLLKDSPNSRSSYGQSENNDYLDNVGYRPVADALEKYPSDGVVAVYIRNARKLVRDKISAYLYAETGKVSRGTSYDQVDQTDSGLILMVKQKMSIDEIASMCSRFGRVDKIDRDLRLIDVTVENSKIVKLDPEASLDSDNPQYYRQQLEALGSFDPEVKMKTVKRLAGVEPKSMRDDISRALVVMLPESPNDLQLEIFKALQVWSKPDDGAGPVVLNVVQQLHKDGEVSKAAMTFLVHRQIDGAQVILMDLWQKDPVGWSELFVNLGEGAQVLLLPELKKMDTVHIVAASDILGKVGAKSCIPYLEAVIEKQEETGKESLKAAIDEIKKRP